MAGQKVVVANADATTHNVHGFDMRHGAGEDELFNLAQPRGARDISKAADGEYQVMKFRCDVHPWMFGYVVVTDHPFFCGER